MWLSKKQLTISRVQQTLYKQLIQLLGAANFLQTTNSANQRLMKEISGVDLDHGIPPGSDPDAGI